MAQLLDRRTWLTEAALAAGGLVVGAEARSAPVAPAPGRMHLGIVTYNVARDWTWTPS